MTARRHHHAEADRKSPMHPSAFSFGSRLSPRVGRHIFSEVAWSAIAHALQLSPRELQIVRCIFDDWKEQAIAGKLGISAHTVHTHLVRLYCKLGVSSRVDLTVRVMAEYVILQEAGGKSATTRPVNYSAD